MKGLVHINGDTKEVMPGEVITYHKKTMYIHHQKFQYQQKQSAVSTLSAQLRQAIIEPTQRYLMQSKQNRIALLVSGGLDSAIIISIIYTALHAAYTQQIYFYALGAKDSNDLQYARKLSIHMGFPLIEVAPYNEKESIQCISDTVYTTESCDPRVIKVALLQDALAKQMQEQKIHVVLSGEGADECWYGYERFINNMQDNQIDIVYNRFFKGVFYYTLFQIFVRVFAKRQIEGRVPFLDQSIVDIARTYTVAEKVGAFEGQIHSKIPLRGVAKDLGLPDFIYNRSKRKMTSGVTTLENTESFYGYLEDICKVQTGLSFRAYCEQCYRYLFRNKVPQTSEKRVTEEEIMRDAQQYRKQNAISMYTVKEEI